MVLRVYVEKKEGFDIEAKHLLSELKTVFSKRLPEDATLRIVNRYDVEGLDEESFRSYIPVVFSEPQVDRVSDELDLPQKDTVHIIATESLPGQFDQRASSAEECVQLISQTERPTVRTAKIY
ncbi:MAG: hypothetical protein LUB61_00825, partial [Eggerthellaceae bacterium]|nr:hypothetical protein [Eggerthellaceae bacterium]